MFLTIPLGARRDKAEGDHDPERFIQTLVAVALLWS
jgi:hypothetical protein